MFSIADGRTSFYQWDLDVRFLVQQSSIVDEVHITTPFSKMAYSMEVYKENEKYYANVPNELLQKTNDIVVYAYYIDSNGSYTKTQETFNVIPRPKPSTYVYTETEVKSFSDLEARIEELEKSGGVTDEQLNKLIGEYFADHPVTETDPTVPDWAKQPTKPEYTAAEVGALSSDDVDSELSLNSTNPIQNKVIAAKIKELEEAVPEIAVDDILSATSTNPVQNKVIAAKVTEIEKSIPDKTSALENDSGFMTSDDVYSKTEIDEKLTSYIDEVAALVGGDA